MDPLIPPPAPLLLAVDLVTTARNKLRDVCARPPSDPREMAATLASTLDLLNRAIGGPTDPNGPAGS